MSNNKISQRLKKMAENEQEHLDQESKDYVNGINDIINKMHEASKDFNELIKRFEDTAKQLEDFGQIQAANDIRRYCINNIKKAQQEFSNAIEDIQI